MRIKDSQLLVLNGPDGKTVTPLYSGDFTPLAIGTGRNLENVPIVFAGYGITAKKAGGTPGSIMTITLRWMSRARPC